MHHEEEEVKIDVKLSSLLWATYLLFLRHSTICVKISILQLISFFEQVPFGIYAVVKITLGPVYTCKSDEKDICAVKIFFSSYANFPI